MGNAIQDIRRILVWLSVLFTVFFFIFLISQLYQFYLLASAISQTLGVIALVFSSLLMAAFVLVPLNIYLRLPSALIPPRAEEEVQPYRQKLLRRLRSNRQLVAGGLSPQADADLDKAIAHLDQEADAIIKRTALSVFLTTSISQNGKLDAFSVLFTHTRMVWKICHLYHQRPNLRELTHLYANIGATTFLVAEIEDLDISLQLESLLAGITKSSGVGSIPVVGPAAHPLADSLFEGSTNAFLTLRVGIIARKYCGCTATWDRRVARKSATIEAGKMLGNIVADGSKKVMGSLMSSLKNAGYQSVKSGAEAVKKAGGKITESIANTVKKANPFKRKAQGKTSEE